MDPYEDPEVNEYGRAIVRGWCDRYLEPDPHYQRIFAMHQKARSHSYVNICWTACCLLLSVYFGYYYFCVETNVKCIAMRNPEFNSLPQEGISLHGKFLKFESEEELDSYVSKHYKGDASFVADYIDMGERFHQSLQVIFY